MRVSFGEAALALTLVLMASATTGAHKRAESESEIVSPVPFVLGSRYGRSPQRLLAPRNDRSETFFMGSRYGKRSEAASSGEDFILGGKDLPLTEKHGREESNIPHHQAVSLGTERELMRPLYCEYTGVPSLFRCRPRNAHTQTRAVFTRKTDDDPTISEEE